MKIELKTGENTSYFTDRVTFEDDGDYIKISYNGDYFDVKKAELRKVLTVLCDE